jgi:TDG/mug DNA glycosylase family protein
MRLANMGPMVAYLAPLLAPNLTVVFVGTEPGPESLASGCYYADVRNTFWSDLHLAGFTPRRFRPCAFREFLELGLGLDDVYGDRRGLKERLERWPPKAICFNSKMALERYAGEAIGAQWRGPDAGIWVSVAGADAVWAVPDSSGRAAAFRDERLSLLTDLRKSIGGGDL